MPYQIGRFPPYWRTRCSITLRRADLTLAAGARQRRIQDSAGATLSPPILGFKRSGSPSTATVPEMIRPVHERWPLGVAF